MNRNYNIISNIISHNFFELLQYTFKCLENRLIIGVSIIWIENWASALVTNEFLSNSLINVISTYPI